MTSALGIFWQRLNQPYLLVRSVYRYYVYFHVQITLHYLGIFYHTKIFSARSKMFTLKVRITAFVMIMVLM